MARERVPLQNIVHEAKRDGIVINQGQDIGKGVFDHLVTRLEVLEARLKALFVRGPNKEFHNTFNEKRGDQKVMLKAVVALRIICEVP